MENLLKGKYFTFFNIHFNQTRIIKFRSQADEFFSANTIWEPRLLSSALFEVETDHVKIPRIGLAPFEDRVRFYFLNEAYYVDQTISFLVLNSLFERFELEYMVVDEHDLIHAFGSVPFEPTVPYKECSFRLRSAGPYRVLFYIDGIYQFFIFLNIWKNDLSKEPCSIHQAGDQVLFKAPGLAPGPVRMEFVDLNNFKLSYDTAESVMEQNVEELYVPLNRIFRDVPDHEIMRYFRMKLEGQYNPAGILKIISFLKFMSDKEEIDFIQNLMEDDRELCLVLFDQVFDFDLLFLMKEEEAREILGLVDDEELALALKGEVKDRIDTVKRYLPDYRVSTLEGIFNKEESVEISKVNEVQKKIGTFVRSYFQKKMGIPFIFEKRSMKRQKIREFSLAYKDQAEGDLPEFSHGGLFLLRVRTIHGTYSGVLNIPGLKKGHWFLQKNLFASSNFFTITFMDRENIHIKFNKDLKAAQVLLFTGKEDTNVFELNKVHNDEIYQLPYKKGEFLRLQIGALSKDKKEMIDEADVFLDLYEPEENFFLPDLSSPQKDFFIKNLKAAKDDLVFVCQEELPLSVNGAGLKQALEINGKTDLSCERSGFLITHLDVLSIRDVEQVKNRVVNNGNLVHLMREERFQDHFLLSFAPAIARLSGRSLCLYSILDSPVRYRILKDYEPGEEEVLAGPYLEIKDIAFEKNLKVIMSTSVGDFTYSFPVEHEMVFEGQGRYSLKAEEADLVLSSLRQKKERTLVDLIMELKVYSFYFKAGRERIYSLLMHHVLKLVASRYFKNAYFVFTPESEFSLFDISEILLHLHDLYRSGLEEMDRMIDRSLGYLSQIKIRDKRLDIYKRSKAKDQR